MALESVTPYYPSLYCKLRDSPSLTTTLATLLSRMSPNPRNNRKGIESPLCNFSIDYGILAARLGSKISTTTSLMQRREVNEVDAVERCGQNLLRRAHKEMTRLNWTTKQKIVPPTAK